MDNRKRPKINKVIIVFLVKVAYKQFFVFFNIKLCFCVDFLLLLKTENSLTRSRFWRENISQKILFFSSIWIYKLLFSRIAENSYHCYTLNKICSTYVHFFLCKFIFGKKRWTIYRDRVGVVLQIQIQAQQVQARRHPI